MTLHEQTCEACRADAPRVNEEEMAALLREIPAWAGVVHHGVLQVERVFTFRNFAEALAFTNRVGEIAEAAGHHPAMLTEWGRVTVRWWTHKIRGLHRNDFILAARTDHLYGN